MCVRMRFVFIPAARGYHGPDDGLSTSVGVLLRAVGGDLDLRRELHGRVVDQADRLGPEGHAARAPRRLRVARLEEQR